MDKAHAVNKINVNLLQEKIDFTSHTHAKELEYWKKVALDNKGKDKRKPLTNLVPLRVSLARKDSIKEVKNVGEIICYLKSRYLPHNEEWGIYIEDIPSQEDQFTFEEISDSTKNFTKSVGEVKNMGLKVKIRRCWAAAYQRLQKYSDTRKISVKRIYLADLKIGCTKSVAWKNKRPTMT